MSRLSELFEQRPIGAVHGSMRSRKQLPFPSGPQFTESANESALVEQLAFSPFVRDLVTQPIIRFEHRGKDRRYSADVFVEYGVPGIEAERFMVEAKLREDIDRNGEEYEVRFQAGRDWCRRNDACFCLLDERDIKSTYLSNVRRLAGSRASVLDERVRSAVSRIALAKGSTVASVKDALEGLGFSAAEAIVAVEKAVIERTLGCDLTKPFGMGALLHPAPLAGAPEKADPFLAVLRKAARRARDQSGT